MKLLVLLFAFAISRYAPGVTRMRRFEWFRWWLTKVPRWSLLQSPEWRVLVSVGVPVGAASAILSLLAGHNHILELLFSILVVVYCLGPDSVMAEVKFLQDKADQQAASSQPGESAKTDGNPEQGSEAVNGHASAAEFNAVDRITQVALERWFAVFFWFLVLGIPGALLYRLTERLGRYAAKEPQGQAADILKQIMEYPVSWLMVLALAVVSDFEKIWEIKKRYLSWENISQLQQKFLYQSMEFAVANCLGADDPECQVSALERTARMTWRMLVTWFVLLSLLVIAGL